MEGDSLLRTIIKGRMEGGKRGRPRTMFLDWMTKVGYSKLNERARECNKWNSIQFIDHLYSPPLLKVHYGRALYSSHIIKTMLT